MSISTDTNETATPKRKGRVKTVFGSHANLAHVWAQQTFDVGYASDRRMFFDGQTIYSYGHHYPMARFTDAYDADGTRIVLFKIDGYSSSTGKHRNLTFRALQGLRNIRIIDVDDVTANPERNARAMKQRLESLIAGLANPVKVRESGLDQRLSALQEACERIADFSLLFDVEDGGELLAIEETASAQITEAWNAFHSPAKVAKREADKRRRDIKRAKEFVTSALETLKEGEPPLHMGDVEASVKAWLEAGFPLETVAPLLVYLQRSRALYEIEQTAKALDPLASEVLTARCWSSYDRKPLVTVAEWLEGIGNIGSLGYQPYSAPTLVRRKGERLETSRGAEVPFKHAVFAYLKAAQCRRDGKTWHRNGEKVAVGVYQLDAIDEHGTITAGCHTIAFDEMQRLAVREVPELVKPSFPLPALIVS